MPQPTDHGTTRAALRRHHLSLTVGIIFSGLILAPGFLHAQLPAGTTDTTAPQPQTQTQQDPLRAQANAALDQHDFPTALRLLTSLTTKNPTDAHLLYDLGFTQEALDQTSSAADTYRRAAAADPKYFEPHLSLGLLLARTGRHDEARTELLTATTLTPSTDPALKARAYRALARLDQTTRPADAGNELLEAMKISPETPDDIILSGELAEASGDLAGAEAAYRRLLAADPQNPTATAALIHLLQREKKPDQAEALLTTALSKNPDDPALNAQLASLYDARNEPGKAIPLIEKLHAANPGDPALTRLLAHLYGSNSQFDKAAPLYATLTTLYPNDPTLVTDRADALIHLSNSPKPKPSSSAPLLSLPPSPPKTILASPPAILPSPPRPTTTHPPPCRHWQFVIQCSHGHRRPCFSRRPRTTSCTRSSLRATCTNSFSPWRTANSRMRSGRPATA